MTIRDRINDEYFNWMLVLACGDRYSKSISFRKLLTVLHDREFIFSLIGDENRALDGVSLRRRFALSEGYDAAQDYLDGPCSVLEMMLALSIRCEETIMDDPVIGNRTGQWFWRMITNLGLGSMTDDRFDEEYVDFVITRFLNREYESDGRGGLFTVEGSNYDLRTVEIWYQLCWYLDSIM